MKTSIKILIVAVSIVVLSIICTVTYCVFDCIAHYYDIQNYIGDWEPQVENPEKYISVIGNSLIKFPSGEINLEKYHPDSEIVRVICIHNGRIYYAIQRYADDSSNPLWGIASVSTSGKDPIEHCLENLFDLNEKESPECQNLNNASMALDAYGTYFSGDAIYLYGSRKNLCLRLNTGVVEDVADVPTKAYAAKRVDAHTLIIEETASSVQKTVTLANMAEKNGYVKELSKVDSGRTWGDLQPLERFFSGVKIIGDEIYIISSVFDYQGYTYAIVFRYDFESEAIAYVTSCKVGDTVSNFYDVITQG